MKVGELRRLIESVPDDTVVVVPAHDHSYLEAWADMQPATPIGKGRTCHFSEWYEGEPGDTVQVLVVGNG